MKKMNKKGFTLAELLIVVAIIAVLVAIAIPVFSSQLEKAKQSTDAANIRSAYAEAITKSFDQNPCSVATTNKMKSAGWDKITATDANATLGGTTIGNISKQKDKTIVVTVSGDNVTFTVGS